jgi:hypothetical protein
LFVVTARIQKDLIECYGYHNPDSPPIFVKNRDDKLEVIDCLIVGPPDTPYEFGFFQFGMFTFLSFINLLHLLLLLLVDLLLVVVLLFCCFVVVLIIC